MSITFQIGPALEHPGKVAVLECRHATTKLDILGPEIDPVLLLRAAAARHSDTCECGWTALQSYLDKQQALRQ